LSALGASSRAVDGFGIERADLPRPRIFVCALDASRASFRTGWASSSRPASVRAVRAVGRDGLAIRTGQLRSTRQGLARPRRRFRIDRGAPRSALLGDQRLTALRVTDCPRLVGWSSLDLSRRRSLTSLVVLAGTAASVPGPTGSWRDARLATHATRSPAQPRSPPCRPCGVTGATTGTPSVVPRSTGFPR